MPEIYDGLVWKSNVVPGGMALDGAISTSGLAVITTTFTIMISNDNGQSFNVTSNVNGPSQDVHILSGDVIAAVGSFATGSTRNKVSGVVVSSDKGQTWTGYNVAESARYGSFPTTSTWYITTGMWSETVSSKKSKSHSLTKRRSIEVGEKSAEDDDAASGWYGKIFKTTDAGSTWCDFHTYSF